jgi:hypothetical protein
MQCVLLDASTVWPYWCMSCWRVNSRQSACRGIFRCPHRIDEPPDNVPPMNATMSCMLWRLLPLASLSGKLWPDSAADLLVSLSRACERHAVFVTWHDSGSLCAELMSRTWITHSGASQPADRAGAWVGVFWQVACKPRPSSSNLLRHKRNYRHN